MKFLCAFLAISSSFIFAGDNQSVTDARRQLDNVRQQVAAGLLPSAKIADAQRALDDATDQAVLEETLYGHLDIQDLTEAQAGEMLAAAQRRVTRAQADVDRGTELISQGVAPRGFNTENLAELDRRKQALQQAENRAELLSEVAAVVHAEVESAHMAKPLPGTLAAKEYVDGSHGVLSTKDIKDLKLAFEKKFDKPLPVSAMGETAVHRALGMDHTGRMDVALLPDSDEGIWLRRYLESKDIAYYAFRVAIPGKATGAHIHVGPGSTRLIVSD